VFYFFFTFE